MLRTSRVRETERRFAEHVAAFDAAAAAARNGCSRMARGGGGVLVPRDLLEQAISALDDGTAHRQLAIELSALTESEEP